MDDGLQAQRREWSRNNKRRRMSLYFENEEQRDRLEAQAAKEGYKRFSTWCLEKIETAATGELTDPRYVARLEAEIEKLEHAVQYEREMAERFRNDLDESRALIQEYASKFAAIAIDS